MLKKLIAGAMLALPLLAQAAVVTSVFTPLGGSKWSVELGVRNDSSATPIGEFTVYFPEGNFSSLALTGSPDTWDTIVLQPDLGIPAPGFVDGLVLDVADALSQGDTVEPYVLTFDLLGASTPFALAFDVYDIAFNLLDSGSTVARILDQPPQTVPEPATSLLTWLGLFAAAIASRRSKSHLRS